MKIKPYKNFNINYSDLIPVELIKKGSYNKILDLVSNQHIVTVHDRYIYSYSLLRTKQPLSALINLWPLVKKYPQLESDCWQIGLLLFKEKDFWSKIDNEKVLYILFQLVSNKIPQHKIYFELQKKLFNLYWIQKEYAKLENILKIYKKQKDGVLIENLSKVNFWQYKIKLPSNIFGFVGYTLTGLGCCILREKFYHNSLKQEFKSAIEELNNVFLECNSRDQLEFTAFKAFSEYESQILIKVLEIAINYGINLDYVGTPSYFLNYDPSNLLFGRFKAFLEEHDPTLIQLYDLNTHNAIVGLLTKNDKILKSVNMLALDPWIVLAIKLRSGDFKSILIEDIDLSKGLDLLRGIFINEIKNMLNKRNDPIFWEILIKIDPILNNLEITYILVNKLIEDLRIQYDQHDNLELERIQNLAKRLNNIEFNEELECLIQRQQECIDLLATIKDYNKSKLIINQIQDQKSLFKHLSLISDLKLLIAGDLSNSLMECLTHFQRLVHDPKINKIEKLSHYSEEKCFCYVCQIELHKIHLPYIVTELGLESMLLPKPLSDIKPYDSEKKSKRSILNSEDPFIALGVNLSDPKAVILKKMLELIKKYPEQVLRLRVLQEELFNPSTRLLHHYFRYLIFKEEQFTEFELLTETIPLREELLHGKVRI